MTALRSHLAHAIALSGHKISKAAAGYKEGVGHCRICLYYEPRRCRIVAGPIDPDDGCRKYFQQRTGSAAAAQ